MTALTTTTFTWILLLLLVLLLLQRNVDASRTFKTSLRHPFVLSSSSSKTSSSSIESIYKIRGGESEKEGNLKEEEDVTNQNEKQSSSNSANSASRKMYNKQASNWVRTKPSCLSDFTGRPVVFSMLEPHIHTSKNTTVLDVGCGEGYCARKLIQMGAYRIIGCDISDKMIQSAIETSKLDNNNDNRCLFFTSSCSNLLQGLKEKVDMDIDMDIDVEIEGMIDVAIAVFLFNYLTTDEMINCMEQVHTTLKPNGIFVFSVPHPSMIYCHEEDAIFRLESKGKGYFSSRDEKLYGYISTIDGDRLNIMSVHKTLNDYIQAINSVGFRIIDIQEAGVKKEHLEINPEFFQSVKDRPLHLIFKLEKI